MFEPLCSPEECQNSLYFELHPREIPRQDACWLHGSLFVKDHAFDFFVDCFQSASGSFDYFSFTRLDEQEIERLVGTLDDFLQDLATKPSRDLLFSRHGHSQWCADDRSWWGIKTEDLASAVQRCGKEMQSFIQTNTKESKCLWVLGL